MTNFGGGYIKLRIELLRKRRGLTQQQLAERIGVVRNAISNWENGVAFPNPRQLPLLADELSCSIDELFGREPKSQDSA